MSPTHGTWAKSPCSSEASPSSLKTSGQLVPLALWLVCGRATFNRNSIFPMSGQSAVPS